MDLGIPFLEYMGVTELNLPVEGSETICTGKTSKMDTVSYL